MKANAATTHAPRFWAMLIESKAPMNPALKTAQEPQPTTLQHNDVMAAALQAALDRLIRTTK